MIHKRSVVIAGHSTSITLEDEFWKALHTIAKQKALTLRALIAAIDAERGNTNLSSAIRVYVLLYYQKGEGESKSMQVRD